MSGIFNKIKTFLNNVLIFGKRKVKAYPKVLMKRRDSSVLLFGVLLTEYELFRRYKHFYNFKKESTVHYLQMLEIIKKLELSSSQKQFSIYNEFLDCCSKHSLNMDICLTSKEKDVMKKIIGLNP